MKKRLFIILSVASAILLLGAAAAAFAVKSGYDFTHFPLLTPKKYDFNENGYADSADAVAIRDYLSDYDYSGEGAAEFDANGDGITTAADFVLVRQYGFDYYTELWRAQYHFSPRYGAINDPNGLVYFKGKWHIFYQYDKTNTYAYACWGHAVSDDLVHWQELQTALDTDIFGAKWSGGAWWDKENHSGLFDGAEDGGMIIAYSTSKQQGIGIAISTDGYTFTDFGIVLNFYGDPMAEGFRDPQLFYSDELGHFVMVIGTGTHKICISDDCKNWDITQRVTGMNTECPDLVKMTVEETGEEAWVFTCAGQYCYLCTFDDGVLELKESGKIRLAEGQDVYAGITFKNEPADRTLMMNWLNTWKYASSAVDGRWTSSLTMITEMHLHYKDGEYYITQNPASEYASLESEPLETVGNKTLSDGECIFTSEKSQIFKAHLEIDVAASDGFEYKFCCDNGGEEETVITFDKAAMKLSLDRSRSIYGASAITDGDNYFEFTVEEKYIENGILDIDIYCDVSCVEMFAAGGRYVLHARIQPFTTSTAMKLTANGRLALKNANIVEMESIWNDSDIAEGVNVYENSVTLTAGDEAGYFLRAASYMNLKEITAECSDESLFTSEIVDGGIMLYGLKAGSGKLLVRSGRFAKEVTVTVN